MHQPNDNTYYHETSGISYYEDKLAIVRSKEETDAEFPEDDPNLTIKSSPVYLLGLPDWEFKGDTVLDEQPVKLYSYRSYFYEKDTVTSTVDQYLFINEASRTVVAKKSVNLVNGRVNQIISYRYKAYAFDQLEPLRYTPPRNYAQTSQTAYNVTRKLKQVNVGEPAPDFSSTTLDGDTFTLRDYRGQRVMLDFSFVGCGGCEMAMKEFNRPDFELAGGMKGVYVNYLNSPAEILKYYKNKGMPFTAIAEAKEPNKMYGVRAYPTFIIIDEEGKVEQVEVGYSEEFIASIEKP